MSGESNKRQMMKDLLVMADSLLSSTLYRENDGLISLTKTEVIQLIIDIRSVIKLVDINPRNVK